MSSIDSRIVTMKFDNSSFKSGVTSTLDLLSKLKLAVTGLGSTKTLGGIDTSKATSGLASVGAAADGIGSKFSAMSVIAVTALATVAHSAVTAAASFAKSFTFGPILDGLAEYQLNLQSIQTIQANTDRPLTEINASLDELNRYSDRTIYNFAEMAKNIGTFTAAGVDLQTATSAIKGIANMAALSGSTSAQASSAMYQLSQALASGKVSLMDWNSVVNAGMGGKKLQTALANTAVAMGTLTKDAISGTDAMDTLKISGQSFRESISADADGNGWLTSDVLKNTLASLDGRFSKLALSTEKLEDGTLKYSKASEVAAAMDKERAKLAKEGTVYTTEQWKNLLRLSDSSFLAATQVKTLSQVFQVAKETLASGWAATFRNIFGDFGEAKKTFTALSGFINDGINAMALARNKVLSRWNEMGGRTAAINAIKNAFQALVNVLKPIGQAFREAFPATTAKELYRATVAIRDWTEGLIASKGTMKDIRSIFGAVFGVMAVGAEIVKGLFRYVFDLIGLLAGGTGGLLDFSGSIAEIIKGLTDWILKGDYIANFFDKVIAGRAALLTPIIKFFSDLLSTLAGFVNVGADVVIQAIGDAIAYLTPYLPVLEAGLRSAGDAVQNYLVAGFERVQPILLTVKDAIADAIGSLSGIGPAIAAALGGLSGIGGSIGGAFGGLGSMFDIGDSADKAASGIEKVKDALSGAGSSASSGAQSGLSAFGEWLKGFGAFVFKTGVAVAAGVAWVAQAIYSEFAGLVSGGSSYIGMIGEFVSSIFSGIGDAFRGVSFGGVIVALNTILMTGIGAALIKFIWSIGGIFSSMRGVFQSMGGVLDQVTSNLKTMQNEVRVDMILKIAIALAILAASIYVLSKIDGAALAKSLGAVALMLTMLVVAMRMLEKSIPSDASLKSAAQLGAMSITLVGLAAAMLLMAIALRIISKLDGGEIAKGLLTMGLALAGIVAATAALNKSGGATSILMASIAIGILAFALVAFAAALKLYAALDTGMLVEGGLKIAALMIGLGIAFRAFPSAGAVVAAAAMFVIANALVILAGALKLIATLDAGDSWQSILTLAAALTILAIAANTMTTAAAGAAALLIMAAALAILVPTLIKLGEVDAKTLVIGLVALVGIFAALAIGGALLTPVVVVLLALGAAILLIGVGMALGAVAMTMFAAALTVLASSGAAAVEVMILVINRFLEAIPGFIQRLGASLKESANQIRQVVPAFMAAAGAIMRGFLREVIKTVPLIGKTFRVIISEALKTLRAAVPDMVVTGFRLLMGLLQGLRKNISDITKTAVDIIVKFINGIANNMDRIVKAGKNLVVRFVAAVASEIRMSVSGLVTQARSLAMDIVTGLANGLLEYGRSKISAAVSTLGNLIPSKLRDILGVFSPSRVMYAIGGHVAEGLALGIHAGARGVVDEADAMGNKALDVLTTTMNRVSDVLAMDPNMTPTITPVLDLNQMQKDASSISGMLETKPINAGVSFAQASDISAEQLAAVEAAASSKVSTEIKLEQNNYSPRALSAVEIYRQTQNQLSLAREALKA